MPQPLTPPDSRAAVVDSPMPTSRVPHQMHFIVSVWSAFSEPEKAVEPKAKYIDVMES